MKMEKKTDEMSGRPFGGTHIVLLCVAFGLLGAALAYLAISNHNRQKQAADAEQAFMDSLHVFPPVEFADSLYNRVVLNRYEDDNPKVVVYYVPDSAGNPLPSWHTKPIITRISKSISTAMSMQTTGTACGTLIILTAQSRRRPIMLTGRKRDVTPSIIPTAMFVTQANTCMAARQVNGVSILKTGLWNARKCISFWLLAVGCWRNILEDVK